MYLELLPYSNRIDERAIQVEGERFSFSHVWGDQAYTVAGPKIAANRSAVSGGPVTSNAGESIRARPYTARANQPGAARISGSCRPVASSTLVPSTLDLTTQALSS